MIYLLKTVKLTKYQQEMMSDNGQLLCFLIYLLNCTWSNACVQGLKYTVMCIKKKETTRKGSQPMNFLFCYTHSLNVSTVMKLKTRQDFVTLSTIQLCTLCYHGMFKYSKWKPALALLITRNALSEYPSKTWVLKSMPSRSHKACELFVLLVQPVCLRSSFRGRAKLSVQTCLSWRAGVEAEWFQKERDV